MTQSRFFQLSLFFPFALWCLALVVFSLAHRQGSGFILDNLYNAYRVFVPYLIFSAAIWKLAGNKTYRLLILLASVTPAVWGVFFALFYVLMSYIRGQTADEWHVLCIMAFWATVVGILLRSFRSLFSSFSKMISDPLHRKKIERVSGRHFSLEKREYYVILCKLETLDVKSSSEKSVEIVLHQDEAAKNCHKELLSLDEDCYIRAGEDIIGAIMSYAGKDLSKLHISAGWEAVLKVALWTSARPAVHDVLALIRKSGASEEELAPFKRSDLSDFFPWLYYGKRFDILRRICNTAKARTESKINRKNLLVYCHLVSDETRKIVASSL